MEALLVEFFQYLFKFIVLGGIAIVGVICGAQYKKNKLAKQEAAEKEVEALEEA